MMQVDELERLLSEIAGAQPAPVADAAAVIGRGRRRLFLRRAGAGVAVLAVVGVTVGVAAGVRDARRGVVVSPTPTTVLHSFPSHTTDATSVIFTSASEGWVCGDPILHTADGGQTWQSQSYTRLAAGTHICAAVPTDAWIVVQSPARQVTVLPAQGGANIAVTIGLPALPAAANVKAVSFADRENGWVLAVPAHGTSRTGLLYRSTQGGVRFALVSSHAPVGAVQFVSAREGWGIDGDLVLHSVDGGASWSKVDPGRAGPPSPTVLANLRGLSAHGSTIVVQGSDPSEGTAVFRVSTDGGRTWAESTAPSIAIGARDPTMFTAIDASHWRLAVGDQIWLTDDGGVIWTGSLLPADVVSVAFPTPADAWAVDKAGNVLRTTDAGRTWDSVDTTPQPVWSSLLAAVPDECPSQPIVRFAGGETDRVTGATRAAREFVLRTRGWTGEETVAVYPVTVPTGQFGVVFSSNVPKFCGPSVADASYGVELFNSSVTQDSSRSTALVVAPFADGWKVWGFYR